MEAPAGDKDSHRFDFSDLKWETYLDEHGYVVIRAAASPEEIEKALDLFWEHFESKEGVKRYDMSTWENWSTDRRGIITKAHVIQCAGAWYVRGLPKIKEIFKQIWKTDDLVVSMDSLLMWKPWWASPTKNPRWLPMTEGLHIDQNPFQKRTKCCVQGMLALYDVTEETGGLEVVPGSNQPEVQASLREKFPHWNGTGDFCMIRSTDPLVTKNRKLILAKAGDFILWDSRTIHGGLVGKGEKVPRDPPRLARLSQTVCMLPRSTVSRDVLEARKRGFEMGMGFTHWANSAEITSRVTPGDYVPIELTDSQKALL